MRKSSKTTLPFMLIALPGVVYLIINNYIPMFGSSWHSRTTSIPRESLAVTGVA